MNFFTLACKLDKRIEKTVRDMRPLHDPDNMGVSEEQARDCAERMAWKYYERNARLGIKLMMRFKEIAKEEGLYIDKLKQHFFITIRPNPVDVTFIDFYNKVKTFIERKCFLKHELTFEQKGTRQEDLGKGFHTHIIAHMSQRSKGEVLRDVTSTFKDMASANCIQVDILKTNDDLERTRGYIVDYHSEDGHKEITKEWDILWRQQYELLPTYTSHLPTIKSRLAGSNGISIEFL